MEKIVLDTDHPTVTIIVWPTFQRVTITSPFVAISMSIEECLEALKRTKFEPYKSEKNRLRRRAGP